MGWLTGILPVLMYMTSGKAYLVAIYGHKNNITGYFTYTGQDINNCSSQSGYGIFIGQILSYKPVVCNPAHIDYILQTFKKQRTRLAMVCNGKTRCDGQVFSSSCLALPPVQHILFEYNCLPVVPDGRIVIDMTQDDRWQLQATGTLVINRTQNVPIARRCIIGGGQPHVNILQLDFGQEGNCRGFLRLHSPKEFTQQIDCPDYKKKFVAKFSTEDRPDHGQVYLDVELVNGFVWLQISARDTLEVTCTHVHGSGNESSESGVNLGKVGPLAGVAAGVLVTICMVAGLLWLRLQRKRSLNVQRSRYDEDKQIALGPI